MVCVSSKGVDKGQAIIFFPPSLLSFFLIFQRFDNNAIVVMDNTCASLDKCQMTIAQNIKCLNLTAHKPINGLLKHTNKIVSVSYSIIKLPATTNSIVQLKDIF